MQIFLACKNKLVSSFSVLMVGNRASADSLYITHLGLQFRSGIDFSPSLTCKISVFFELPLRVFTLLWYKSVVFVNLADLCFELFSPSTCMNSLHLSCMWAVLINGSFLLTRVCMDTAAGIHGCEYDPKTSLLLAQWQPSLKVDFWCFSQFSWEN